MDFGNVYRWFQRDDKDEEREALPAERLEEFRGIYTEVYGGVIAVVEAREMTHQLVVLSHGHIGG